MRRRLLVTAVAAVIATTGTALVGQAPARAWTKTVSAQRYYPTHGGTLYIYTDGQGHNWGCSGGGLVMDCADGQNVYASASASTSPRPAQVMVQSQVSFSGSALSVGVPPNAGWSGYGVTCTSPAFTSRGTFVSAYTSGPVCHAQTFLAITGMTLKATGWGQWGGAWDGATTSAFLDMYPA